VYGVAQVMRDMYESCADPRWPASAWLFALATRFSSVFVPVGRTHLGLLANVTCRERSPSGWAGLVPRGDYRSLPPRYIAHKPSLFSSMSGQPGAAPVSP